jgi:hypothetical protein
MAFEKFDVDGSGKLTRDEVSNYIVEVFNNIKNNGGTNYYLGEGYCD